MILKFISLRTCTAKHLHQNKTINFKLVQSFFRHFSLKRGSDVMSSSLEVEEDVDFEELNVEKFSQLIKNNEMRKKIERILSEYEYEKYTTLRVPKTLTTDHMNDLLRAKDLRERQVMMNFFYIKECEKLTSKRNKKLYSQQYWAQKHKHYEERNARNIPKTGIFDAEGNIIYGLWHNTLFSKILRNSISRMYTNRLKTAALFGQKLIIDLDFDQYMRLAECRSLAQQIQYCISYNKYDTIEPFDIHFTNCNPHMPTIESIPRYLPNFNLSDSMSAFHRQSYLDLFPREKLVYLSENAEKPLTKYSHEDIYIIAGHVNKSCPSPVAYIKAKNEGIRVCRLPTDEHVLWSEGSNKHLCINHIIAILHDVKMSGKWRDSFIRNIPGRKLKKVEDIQYEDMLREQKIKKRIKLENMQRKKDSELNV